MRTTTLSGLKDVRPEWMPWLTVVEETLREADASSWESPVPADPRRSSATSPLLAGATLVLEPGIIRRLLQRLIRVAAASGTPAMATLRSVPESDVDLLDLFKASLRQDTARISDLAPAHGADPDAFQAVIALLAVPFLQACTRRWSGAMHPGWIEGYCQLCAAWPAFSEARGIERNRFFRCGRCGSEWHARPLRCPYCGVDDHDALVSLVPEDSGMNAVIEGCRSCHGYVKTFTRLQGCAPRSVMLEDLASVHFDVAAIAQGYLRPATTGHPLDLAVTAKNGPRRFVPWKA